MTYLERDLEQALRSVAGGAALRPEEESAMLTTLLAALDGATPLSRVPGAAWRWLGATVVALLMLFSMMSPWQTGHVVLARACITPEMRVTAHPAPTSLLVAPVADLDSSMVHLRPDVVIAPRVDAPAQGNATLSPSGSSLSGTS